MGISIQRLTTNCKDKPEYKALFDEYAKECGVSAFGDWKADWKVYETLEGMGGVQAFCAYDGSKPIGLIVGIESEQFHFSLYTLTVDAIFVLKEYRNTSVSSRLIARIMREAKAKRINQVLFSCPPNGDLDKALSHQKNFQLISKLYRRKLWE